MKRIVHNIPVLAAAASLVHSFSRRFSPFLVRMSSSSSAPIAAAAGAAAAPAASSAPAPHACHALASRLEGFGAPTVWEEFTPLARSTGAINLGQGFPDWASPRFVKDAIIRSVEENNNQYCRSAGHPPLVQALAKRCVLLSRRVSASRQHLHRVFGASRTHLADDGIQSGKRSMVSVSWFFQGLPQIAQFMRMRTLGAFADVHNGANNNCQPSHRAQMWALPDRPN